MTAHQRVGGTFSKLVLGSLLLVLILAALRLPAPFTGDQALFTTAAEAMQGGAKLYRDIWDIKQPGIFLFYQAAGNLLGFTETGVHGLELLYQLAFACVLLVTLSRHFENPVALAAVPLLTVGFYYAVSDDWSLTQIEALAGFPLYVCLWGAFRGSERGPRAKVWWFVSGLMAGVVAVFKIVLVGIPCVLWLIALYSAAEPRSGRGKTLTSAIACLVLGISLPIAGVILFASHEGTLSLLYWSSFVYPRLYMAQIHRGTVGWLVRSVLWFFGTFGPLMVLGLLGAWLSIRRRESRLTVYLLAWLISGFAVIVIQRLSWWEYHFYLLFTPLGILAAKGIDLWMKQLSQLARSMGVGRPQWLGVAVLVLLFGGVVENVGMTSLLMGRAVLRTDLRVPHGYQMYISNTYRGSVDDVAFLLTPESRPGPIVVLGDPLNLYLSKRRQAIASNGWILEYYIASKWKQLADELGAARPPYVFVANEYRDLIEERGAAARGVLDRYYKIDRTSGSGVWYQITK